MDRKKRKVAVIGALNVDIGGLPEAAFVPGDSIPGRISVSLGGVGFNIARNCASMGMEVSFFSVLGRDADAAQILREAERSGVSLEHCRWIDAQNNRYLYICGQGGEMTAAINDMRLCRQMDPDFADSVLRRMTGFSAVVLDANLPEETLLHLAKHMHAPIVADCVSAVKCGRLRSCLPHIHTIKANRMEAEMLTGRIEPEDCARALLDVGVKRAVISLGAEGIICGENGHFFRLPAERLPVRDTTGAGDGLTAALTAGLACGFPLERCAELGIRAAALAMARHGTVTDNLSSMKEAFL